jgi:hypothetical protein
MMAKVPTIDIGSARLGMSVAERLRRKRKDHHHDQRQGEQQAELHVVHGLADRERAVVEDLEA